MISRIDENVKNFNFFIKSLITTRENDLMTKLNKTLINKDADEVWMSINVVKKLNVKLLS